MLCCRLSCVRDSRTHPFGKWIRDLCGVQETYVSTLRLWMSFKLGVPISCIVRRSSSLRIAIIRATPSCPNADMAYNAGRPTCRVKPRANQDSDTAAQHPMHKEKSRGRITNVAKVTLHMDVTCTSHDTPPELSTRPNRYPDALGSFCCSTYSNSLCSQRQCLVNV